MNICFCINDSYIDILKVCMFSVLENNKNIDIEFYIFSSDLSDESKNKLDDLRNRFNNFKIQYITIDKDIFNNLKSTIDYISIDTYYRYIIANILSDKNKALYLDADIIVNGNLEELYDTDIEDYYCAGVKDIYIEKIKHAQEINLSPNATYINAGVLLLNLNKLRKEHIFNKLLDKTIEMKNIIKYADQDVINIVFSEKIKLMDSIYNYTSNNMHKEWKKHKQAIIIHYTGPKKPWHPKCHNKMKKLWRKYDLLCSGHKNFYQKYLKNFCEKIFSVKNNKWTHKTITLFNIKFSFPKIQILMKKKDNPYDYCKKHNFDITKVPQATGQIRNIQLANFALLKELDYVCKQNNLKYWLDGGTLLGAIRHKGFIPWDDDIDVAMMRGDYVQIIDAFKKSSRDPDIYAGYYRNKNFPSLCFIKVQHKKCPYLFVDIFPWDYYGKKLTIEEQVEKSAEIKVLISDLDKNINLMMSDNEIIKINHQIMKEKVLNINNSEIEQDGDFVWGIDFHHAWENWFTRYNVVYPYKTIEFEGHEFPCLSRPEDFLTRLYGNYMEYPKKLTYGHNMYKNFSEKEYKVVMKLANQIESS